MTDPKTCTIDNLPRKAAAATPCSECPWRKSNADRPHFNNQYSTEEFTRLWRSIAVDGNFFGCHLMDADYHPVPAESLAMGYQKPADIGARRECAGALAVVRRELKLLNDYDTHEDYIAARPVGLSKKALDVLLSRSKGELEPALRFASNEDETDVADPMERVNTSLIQWQVSRNKAADLLAAMEAFGGSQCDCKVCTNHTSVHRPAPLALPDGTTAEVDQELHGVLTAMTRAGIKTVDSCINMAEALDELWPDRKPTLLRVVAGRMNYRTMIQRQAAHIRFANTTEAGKAIAVSFARVEGVEVVSAGSMTQVVFDAGQIPVLERIAEATADYFAPRPKSKPIKRPSDYQRPRKR